MATETVYPPRMSVSPSPTRPACRFDPKPQHEDTLVCHCKSVTESRIHTAMDDGARDLQDVAAKTGACTGCGACACRVNRVLMGLPAKCGGSFDHCHKCGCAAIVCECAA